MTGKLPIFIASSPDELDPSRLDIYDYIQYSSTNNTSIKLANSDIEARKHKLKATKRAKRPTFNFLLSGDESFNDGGEVGKVRSGKAILQMNYRLFDGYAQRAQVELVSSQISEMKIGREKALRDLNKKIKLAYYQLKSMGEEKQYAQAEIAYSDDEGATWTTVDVGIIVGEFVSNGHALFALKQRPGLLGQGKN